MQEVEGAGFELWDTVGSELFFGAFHEKLHLNCFVVNADKPDEAQSTIEKLQSMYQEADSSFACIVFTRTAPSDQPLCVKIPELPHYTLELDGSANPQKLISFFQELLERIWVGKTLQNAQEPSVPNKKLLRAKEKAEKQAKKAEEAELKLAYKLYEKDMEIYRLESQKAEMVQGIPPQKPVGPKEVEQAEMDLKENKDKFNKLCDFVLDMFRERKHIDAALANVMDEGSY